MAAPKFRDSESFQRAAKIINYAVVLTALAGLILDKTLPYRIGPAEYSSYLWAHRLTAASLLGGLVAVFFAAVTRRGAGLLTVFCALILVMVFGGGVGSAPSPEAWCYLNLERINAAKTVLARQGKLPNGAAVTLDQILPFIDKNAPPLKCYDGGTYAIGAIGEEARCSVHGTMSSIESRWKSADGWYKLSTHTNTPKYPGRTNF